MGKELHLLNQKIIYDLTKFTSTDYKGHLSCIIWFCSCNMACLYCYNKDLVFAKEGKYTMLDILRFLEKRVDLLDAVVLSGGEASRYDLVSFCKEIKQLPYKIKLDTNGTNPKQIKELIDKNLIDFVSLDFKGPKDKYKKITNLSSYNSFLETIKILLKENLEFEVRTTVNSELLNEKDINSMIRTLKLLNYKNTYYLQNFLDTENNIGNIKKAKNLDMEKIESLEMTLEWRN